MKGEIRHKDSRVFDLALGVTASEYAELEGSQGKSHRNDPLWFCGGCNGGLYIVHGRLDPNQLFGYHFAAGTCKTLTINKMTDEHKREIEHHVLVIENLGSFAETEVPTAGRRTRVDVVADGRIGIEVQRSELTAGAAIRRTRASMTGGLEHVSWCTDLPGRMSPKWIGKVPGYRIMAGAHDWSMMTPPPRSVEAAGVSNVISEPHPFRRGVWRPKLDAVSETLVDDIMAGLIDGSIKSVVYGKYVRLITSQGIALYEELTGDRLAPFTPGSAPKRSLPSAERVSCHRPSVAPLVPVLGMCTWCGQLLGALNHTIHPACADERAIQYVEALAKGATK